MPPETFETGLVVITLRGFPHIGSVALLSKEALAMFLTSLLYPTN